MILFVCTGNICRSAMAEALLARRAHEAGLILETGSAGSAATPGSPATDHAVEVLAERGIDLGRHRARRLDADVVAAAELIVVMTRPHEAAVAGIDQAARARTFLAGEVARLAGHVAPPAEDRADRAAWVAAMHGARGGHMTTGRTADEVPDPWGESVEVYRRTADRLDGLVSALVRAAGHHGSGF